MKPDSQDKKTGRMRILTPIARFEDVEAAAAGGADECYCGLHLMDWGEKYGHLYYGTNRSDFYHQNFLSAEDLAAAVEDAHARSLRVYLTMNVPYPADQLSLVERQIEIAADSGIDAIILGDVGLIQWIRRRGLDVELHVSCDMTSVNKGALDFFARFGVTRVVLPRHMTLSEIAALQAHADRIGTVALEIFVINGNCINLDGMCGFHHGVVGYLEHPLSKVVGVRAMNWGFSLLPAASREPLIRMFGHRYPCCQKYDATPIPAGNEQNSGNGNSRRNPDEDARAVSELLDRQFLRHMCGACALFDLKQAGVRHVKIIGRENFGKRKAKDLKFIRRLIDLLEENHGMERPAFANLAKELYNSTYGRNCTKASCFYPS